MGQVRIGPPTCPTGASPFFEVRQMARHMTVKDALAIVDGIRQKTLAEMTDLEAAACCLAGVLNAKKEVERLADPKNWACEGMCEGINDSMRNKSLAAIRAETCAGCKYKHQYEAPKVEPEPVRVVTDRDFEGHHVLIEQVPGTAYCTMWYRLTIDGIVRQPPANVWWELTEPTDLELRKIIAGEDED